MQAGFDMRQLNHIGEKMQRNFETGKAAASAIRIARHGHEYYRHTVGYADVEAKAPIKADTIFRLYSMSKPITMTAFMQLYEKGLVYLEDPLYEYIPEFREMPVAVEHSDGTVTFEKQRTPITLKNLLTMTSGIAYPDQNDPGARAMLKAMEALDAQFPNADTLACVRYAATHAALSFQPGTRWKYGFSHDVVGAVIEVVSGQRFGDYLRDHIFTPLQMPDTDFLVPSQKQLRFCNAYTYDGGQYTALKEDEFGARYLQGDPFQSGGGGLVSTIDDYAHFCQALVDGGTWGGERILGRKTIDMMRADQLTEQQRETYDWQTRGYGYGIGMRTHLRPMLINGTFGEFGWDGMMGTFMLVDPAEGLTVVYMQNMLPYNTNGMRLLPIVYGAMI